MTSVLKKDMWFLDTAGTFLFGAAASAEFQVLSDSGDKHLDRILPAVAIAVLAYFFTFLTGFAISRIAPFIRSWIWMSMVGALVYVMAITIKAMPMWLDYYNNFDQPAGMSLGEYFSAFLPSMIGLYLVWAISGSLFLIALRYAISFFRRP